MSEKPILFSGAMVRALLDGRKTQTRRIVKPQPNIVHAIHPDCSISTNLIFRQGDQRIHSPYKVGDRIWVRETWTHWFYDSEAKQQRYWYRADYNGDGVPDGWDHGLNRESWDRWRPSIHMPKAAARIWLEVIAVRVERLQDISNTDAVAEGCSQDVGLERWEFLAIWEECYGKASFELNPWVWVIEFKQIEVSK